jgi:DNA-binding transcriptional LysR family regulator
MFDWNDLKHFLAFARTGSMLAAAKALGVNQSTVSRRLAELEERLGRRLVERHLGGYRLTELGEQLWPDAERIEAAVAAFERHLASCQKEITGMLRLTCPTTIAHRLARTSLIDAFHARHPGLRVELVMSDHYLDLAKGEARHCHSLRPVAGPKPCGPQDRRDPLGSLREPLLCRTSWSATTS